MLSSVSLPPLSQLLILSLRPLSPLFTSFYLLHIIPLPFHPQTSLSPLAFLLPIFCTTHAYLLLSLVNLPHHDTSLSFTSPLLTSLIPCPYLLILHLFRLLYVFFFILHPSLKSSSYSLLPAISSLCQSYIYTFYLSLRLPHHINSFFFYSSIIFCYSFTPLLLPFTSISFCITCVF